MEFKAKQFNSRQDLEDYLKIKADTNIEANKTAGHTIKGTAEELKKLHLSDITSVFGCRVVVTDFPTDKKIEAKIKK